MAFSVSELPSAPSELSAGRSNLMVLSALLDARGRIMLLEADNARLKDQNRLLRDRCLRLRLRRSVPDHPSWGAR